MKRTWIILFVSVLLFTGCTEKEENKIMICERKTEDVTRRLKWDDVDTDISTLYLEYTYDNQMFGVEDVSTLKKEEQRMIQDNLLLSLGLEKEGSLEYKVNFKMEKEMTLQLEIDLAKASLEFLNSFDLPFEDTKLDSRTVLDTMKKEKYICK